MSSNSPRMRPGTAPRPKLATSHTTLIEFTLMHAAGRILAGSAGSLTDCAGGSAAGEPDLLGWPALDPVAGELGKVVVGGAGRHLDLDQVFHRQAAPGHEPDPFPCGSANRWYSRPDVP